MKDAELIGHLKDIDAHLSVIRGRQDANALALQFLLMNNPKAMKQLQSLDLTKVDWLLQGRSVTDENILHTLDQLRLLRGELDR